MTDVSSASGAEGTPARPEVRVVAGRLADHELAAVTVALAAVNAASRAEAAERAMAEGTDSATPPTGWADPVHRLPRMHDARAWASATSWAFSHR